MKSILLLVLFCQAVSAHAASSETKTLKLPDGRTVATTSTEVKPQSQKFRSLSVKELGRIEELRKQSEIFVRVYLPNAHNPTLKDYDRAFRAWQVSKPRKYTDKEVIEMIGSLLGTACVRELNMEWVEVTDEYGTDFAVRAKKAEVISFPYSVVAKRIESNEYEFVYSVFHAIKELQDGNEVMPR
jgi:hypothetical protein